MDNMAGRRRGAPFYPWIHAAGDGLSQVEYNLANDHRLAKSKIVNPRSMFRARSVRKVFDTSAACDEGSSGTTRDDCPRNYLTRVGTRSNIRLADIWITEGCPQVLRVWGCLVHTQPLSARFEMQRVMRGAAAIHGITKFVLARGERRDVVILG